MAKRSIIFCPFLYWRHWTHTDAGALWSCFATRPVEADYEFISRGGACIARAAEGLTEGAGRKVYMVRELSQVLGVQVQGGLRGGCRTWTLGPERSVRSRPS